MGEMLDLVFDRQGRPIPVERWAELRRHYRYRQIALTILPDGRTVTTVWVGISTGTTPPLIFETMIFIPPPKCEFEDGREQYSTEAEALTGHEAIVQRGGFAPDD